MIYNYLVSSLISTYNSSSFLEGALLDLISQTIYIKGKMEIIVIDSCSSENEKQIVSRFQKFHNHIKYIRTNKRETLYKAWNRGINASCGQYITNANTDDRRETTCIEKLISFLEDNSKYDICYGNLYKSTIANEIFSQNSKSLLCSSQNFSPGTLLLHNFIGAQPVWRKSLHKKIGFFNECYEVVGDYDFVLRAIANGCKFSYVPDAKGLMLWHQNALSTKDSKALSEKHELLKFYRSPDQIRKIYSPYFSGISILQLAYNDLGIRSLCYYPQFNSGNPLFDFSFAEECFSRNTDHISQLNLKTLRKILGSNLIVEDNENDNLFFYSYSEKLPTEYELKGVDPLYVKKTGMENILGKVCQKYSFNLNKFYQFFFGHIDIQCLSNANSVYIWGYNERGKIFAKYLESCGLNNVMFIDTKPQIFTKPFQSNENLPLSLEDVKDTENVVFILTMSSHHWPTVRTEIEKKFPGSRVLTFDKD